MFLSLQHFGDKGACWSSGMGLRKMTNNLIIHMFLHKTKQQIGQCKVGDFLVLGRATSKFELIRFITTRILGKRPPSPLQYTLCLSIRPTSKWHFVPGLPSGSLEIPKFRTSAILGAHNFLCKPPIEMRSKEKLYPSSRSFQQYVA